MHNEPCLFPLNDMPTPFPISSGTLIHRPSVPPRIVCTGVKQMCKYLVGRTVTYPDVCVLIPWMLHMAVTDNEVSLCGESNNGNHILSTEL